MPNSPSAKVCEDLQIFGLVKKKDWSFDESLRTKSAKKGKERQKKAKNGEKSERQKLLDSL